MDIWRITKAVLRRWYVFLPLAVLTVFAAQRVGAGIHPQYESTATAILVAGTGSTQTSSPYGGRDETGQVLSVVLNSLESREWVDAQGLNSDYEVHVNERSPFLNVIVLSDTPGESEDTADAVLDLAVEELAQRQTQSGIPTAAQIKLQVLQEPSVSVGVTDVSVRNMVVVGIIGVAISLQVTVLLDALMRSMGRSGRVRGRRPQ